MFSSLLQYFTYVGTSQRNSSLRANVISRLERYRAWRSSIIWFRRFDPALLEFFSPDFFFVSTTRKNILTFYLLKRQHCANATSRATFAIFSSVDLFYFLASLRLFVSVYEKELQILGEGFIYLFTS